MESKSLRRNRLAKQIKIESALIKKESLKVLAEFEKLNDKPTAGLQLNLKRKKSKRKCKS